MKIVTYFMNERLEAIRDAGLDYNIIKREEAGARIEIEIEDGLDVIVLFSAGVNYGTKKAYEDIRRMQEKLETSKHPVHISVPLKEIENQLQQASQR